MKYCFVRWPEGKLKAVTMSYDDASRQDIPLAQLKHPGGLARTRIYDRVLERCQPVMFDGPSFRAAKAEENRAAVRRILDGVK